MKFTLLFIALALCTSSWAESIKGSPNIYGAGYHWGCSTLNNDQSEMADLVALQWIMGFHSGLSFAGAFTDHAPKGHNLPRQNWQPMIEKIRAWCRKHPKSKLSEAVVYTSVRISSQP